MHKMHAEGQGNLIISGLASPQGRQKPSRKCALPTLNMSTNNIEQAGIDQTRSIENQNFTFAMRIENLYV